MAWIEGKQYRFTDKNVQLAPDEEGVYGITDPDDNPIYIGRGAIGDRLTRHFRKQDPADDCIWKYNPTYYYREACSNSEEREKQLILEFSPYCNVKIG